METQGMRLRRLREAKGLTQGELARQAGLRSQGAIGNIERDTRGYGASVVEIARILGTTPEHLQLRDTGKTGMSDAVTYSTTKIKSVPVVGKGSGGEMPERIWTDGDHPVGETDECADIATSDPHAFLVSVSNTSMVPRYNPGEFALVEPGTEPELEDDVLVRLSDGQTMLKRLLSRRSGWRFGSYNTQEVLHFGTDEVTWVYYVAHPVPRRKIKTRC